MSSISISQSQQRIELAKKLNWLRAAVLGANDGIVSTAGIVMGVAGATTESAPILIAGIAAMVAGSISMAGGEYASVSAQRDSEKAAIAREQKLLDEDPVAELEVLAKFYQDKGISSELALKVATELSEKDAIRAHLDAELERGKPEFVSPMAAAVASFFAFALGSLLPIIAISGPWIEIRKPATVAAVVVALAITGYVAAKIGRAKPLRAVVRNVLVSLLTMGFAYLVGTLLGVAVV